MSAEQTTFNVEIQNETGFTLDDDLQSAMIAAVHMALEVEGISVDGEVSISIVDDEEIQALNREYRNKDVSTDVLSFPQYEPDETIESYAYLGDIVISAEHAQSQAACYDHSIKREFVYLTVHSMFHLLGYDHMTDHEKKEMRLKEKEALSRLGIFKTHWEDA
jgi:probable rRNA maturation factor